jgi:hypothetical protein
MKPNSYARDPTPRGSDWGGGTVPGLSELIEDLVSVEFFPSGGYGSCKRVASKSFVARRPGIKVVVFSMGDKSEWKALNNLLSNILRRLS